MLQDLSFGRLENEFHTETPDSGDFVLCFRNREILMGKGKDSAYVLPCYDDVIGGLSEQNAASIDKSSFQYVFTMQGIKYFLYMGEAELLQNPTWDYVPVSELRRQETKEVCFAVMTGLHLNTWYLNHRYCGRCSAPTEHDEKERMLRCPKCGNMIFPVISPAVIIAVTDGDRLLLSKYAGRSYSRYALLAGYTEIGETLEQTVEREVMEEVGLKVKNIRYYKSQPWGIDGSVLMGFYCDLDGSDKIKMDKTELSLAEWYLRDNLPAHDDGISLTREMIGVFEEGNEPL